MNGEFWLEDGQRFESYSRQWPLLCSRKPDWWVYMRTVRHYWSFRRFFFFWLCFVCCFLHAGRYYYYYFFFFLIQNKVMKPVTSSHIPFCSALFYCCTHIFRVPRWSVGYLFWYKLKRQTLFHLSLALCYTIFSVSGWCCTLAGQ